MKDFAKHAAQWRDPAQIASQWQSAGETDFGLLRHTVSGRWWEVLAERRLTLIVSRETEHLLMALRCDDAGPDISFVRLPHPSGIAVDRDRQVVHVASTRNPNQIFDFEPGWALGNAARRGERGGEGLTLMPLRSRLLPGSLYLHDLALIGGELHAAAVGQNAIVEVHPDGRYRRVWWPQCVDTPSGPVFQKNHVQLNSIAAGPTVDGSYFGASTDQISSRRPGHLNFPVDRRGVIFSGRTREPVVRGLTRPHSVRLHDGRLWVDDSGYGTFGYCEDGRLTVAARLPGWTRGLAFSGSLAFIGTSRVIPRFRGYAPGLDVDTSVCGIHAVDATSGESLGSIVWPAGNQIFGIEWIDSSVAGGLPFRERNRSARRDRELFYSFATASAQRRT